MKLITPKVEIIKQEQNDELCGIFKQIERAGRTCYKSEDKITDDSAKEFVENLIERKHFAMLEHGTVYLKINEKDYGTLYDDLRDNYIKNNYSYINSIIEEDYTETSYITTNYRVIIENNWTDDLKYLCEPTHYHAKRITLKFTTNIGVTREGNRMRANSIAEESTRYCDYSKDKFGNAINYTLPTWINPNETEILACRDAETESRLYSHIIENIDGEEYNWNAIDWYLYALSTCAFAYKQLRKLGWTPQQAREVLPLATKSEIVYTAFTYNWRHWFDLRLYGTTGKPHPNIEQISELAKEVLIKEGLWELIYPETLNTFEL